MVMASSTTLGILLTISAMEFAQLCGLIWGNERLGGYAMSIKEGEDKLRTVLAKIAPTLELDTLLCYKYETDRMQMHINVTKFCKPQRKGTRSYA